MRGKFCDSLRNGSYTKVVDCLLFNLSANAATVAKSSTSHKSISTKTPSQYFFTGTDVFTGKELLSTEKQGVPFLKTGSLTSTR